MAKRKAVIEKKTAEEEFIPVIGEEAVSEPVAEPTPTVTTSPDAVEAVTDTVVAPPPAEPDFSWVPAELEFAQHEVEKCLDYINTPGADHSGRFKASFQEWTEYKYRLRQMVLHKSSKVPVRPAIQKDY